MPGSHSTGVSSTYTSSFLGASFATLLPRSWSEVPAHNGKHTHRHKFANQKRIPVNEDLLVTNELLRRPIHL